MLIDKCIAEAKNFGFKKLYLETMPELAAAIVLYKKFDFKYLSQPVGESGHNGCSIWMMKEI